MQPYFFPYLGYFQLMHASDQFVLFDDVNFIKRGYIHRNNILLNGEAKMFSVPLSKASQNVLIKDVSTSGLMLSRFFTPYISKQTTYDFSYEINGIMDILLSKKKK